MVKKASKLKEAYSAAKVTVMNFASMVSYGDVIKKL